VFILSVEFELGLLGVTMARDQVIIQCCTETMLIWGYLVCYYRFHYCQNIDYDRNRSYPTKIQGR